MSGIWTFALLGSASSVELAEPYKDPSGPVGEQDQMSAFLGDPAQQVFVELYRTTVLRGSSYLGGGGSADAVISIDFERSMVPEAVFAPQQAEVAAQYIQDDRIDAGVFEDSDEVCFLYWGEGVVVVISHPYVVDSVIVRALRDELAAAGIDYGLESLDPYFIWSPDT